MTPSRVLWIAAPVAVAIAFGVAAFLAEGHENEFLRVALPGYLTAFGTLALAGTTVWLRRSEQQEHRLERSRAAAFTLARSFMTVTEALGRVPPGRTLDVGPLLLDVATYSGDLVDIDVMRRVNEVADRVMEFEQWNTHMPWGAGGPTQEYVDMQPGRKEVLSRYLGWIGRTLSAHRAGRPLPEPLPPAL